MTENATPKRGPGGRRPGAGRPALVVTPRMRKRVAILAGGGVSRAGIASALGIDDATLRKHFGDELTDGAQKARAEVMEALRRQAMKGSTAAAKAYLAYGDPIAPQPRAEKPEKVEPLGKKAKAEADAHVAHVETGWGDLVNPARDRVQ